MSDEFYGFDDPDFDEDEDDVCPHGIGYDEPCEECEEEDSQEVDPPSASTPLSSFDLDKLPF